MIDLRDYQKESVEELRNGIRAGHKAQVLSAPTGSGKTVIASYLMQEASNKMSHATFLCDRVALVDQTSKMLDAYEIPHGVLQADHWRRRPWERIQVASIQTLARRGIKQENTKLLIWDECHTLFESAVKIVKENPEIITIGLSATPFTKGMGKIFTNIVNVTTTNALVADGFLSPIKAYAARRITTKGIKVDSYGEWDATEVEKRSLLIVGDIVESWRQKTFEHFGGPVKTLVFSATVAHGEELCRQWQEAGFNFQQVSYKDGNDDRRRALIEEFRKADSEIDGLVSCEALAKGFDVPDIRCGVSCRPYRKSLSGFMQQLGRVMRAFPDKEYALWLDHAGNYIRFAEDTAEIFERGIHSLNDSDLDSKVRKEPEDKDDNLVCKGCGFVMLASDLACPSCGKERPHRTNEVEHAPGELVSVNMHGKLKKAPEWMQDKETVWKQIVGYALEKKADPEKAERWAKAQYRQLYGTWPRHAMRNITPEAPVAPLVGKLKSMMIAYAKGKGKAA